TTSCGVCDPERCEETATSCPSGLIRDACDCCYVCGNLEDTPCDLPSDVFRFGECGEGLICSPSGSSAVFSCSVSGFPLAWFEWLMNGESVFRPNLGGGVLTQVRSGPLPYQVTTWLEIDRVMPSHSGLFTCVARNEHGETNATARLEVVP
uniref:Ig-like domain-containing protein n=1 Tax=Ciona savignyi TaxID=51511 RepID=H2ZLY2_CIOSA